MSMKTIARRITAGASTLSVHLVKLASLQQFLGHIALEILCRSAFYGPSKTAYDPMPKLFTYVKEKES